MQNVGVEGMIRNLKAMERFVDGTSVIIDKLCDWKLDSIILQKMPTREEVLAELKKFKVLSLQAKKDGIIDEPFIQGQGRNVVETFKMLSDIVPELSKLQ